MKTYCVTYYDGKGERYMYVQAKSINAANDLLRKNKTIGAAVRKVERVSMLLNTMRSNHTFPLPASEVARIIKERDSDGSKRTNAWRLHL